MRASTLAVLGTATILIAACGATPTGDDDVTTTDAGIDSPPDLPSACGTTERNMGAPVKWSCGGSSGPGPEGVINTPDPVTTSLEVGPMPQTPEVCGVRAAGVINIWIPWTRLKFFGPTLENPDRFYFQPQGWTDWIRCSRL